MPGNVARQFDIHASTWTWRVKLVRTRGQLALGFMTFGWKGEMFVFNIFLLSWSLSTVLIHVWADWPWRRKQL
jgi:hypothetical protein